MTEILPYALLTIALAGIALWRVETGRWPRWALALPAALVALLVALAGRRRRPVVEAPPVVEVPRVRRTAEDLIRENGTAERLEVARAAGDPERLADVMRGQR